MSTTTTSMTADTAADATPDLSDRARTVLAYYRKLQSRSRDGLGPSPGEVAKAYTLSPAFVRAGLDELVASGVLPPDAAEGRERRERDAASPAPAPAPAPRRDRADARRTPPADLAARRERVRAAVAALGSRGVAPSASRIREELGPASITLQEAANDLKWLRKGGVWRPPFGGRADFGGDDARPGPARTPREPQDGPAAPRSTETRRANERKATALLRAEVAKGGKHDATAYALRACRWGGRARWTAEDEAVRRAWRAKLERKSPGICAVLFDATPTILPRRGSRALGVAGGFGPEAEAAWRAAWMRGAAADTGGDFGDEEG